VRGPPGAALFLLTGPWRIEEVKEMPGLLITIAVVLGGFFLVFYVFFPLGRGAVYVPSTREKTLLISELSGAGPGETAADLGAGDGRLVIALARRGAEAHGFEVNPVLVILARRNIRRAGLQGRAFIHWKSFWRARLSRFDVLTVFQGSFVMRRLEAKVRRELAPGARVVSDYWGFPTLKAERTHGTVSCYRMGLPVR
jgi:ribosomal protein L11 methylase PrmA